MIDLGRIIGPLSTAMVSVPMGLAEATVDADAHAIGDITKRLEGHLAALGLVEDEARKLGASLRGSDAEFEAAIEVVANFERHFAEIRSRQTDADELILQTAAAQTPQLLADLRQLRRTGDDLLVRALTTLRDLRWALIASHAEQSPVESGEIIKTADQVKAWARSLEN